MRFLFAFTLMIISTGLFAQDNQKIQLANEYYLQGDTEKALDLYEELAKDSRSISLIHTNYFALLIASQEYKEAKKYIERQIKDNPSNIYYKIDLGTLYMESGEPEKAAEEFQNVIATTANDQYKMRIAAQYFINKQLFNEALQIYVLARKNSRQEFAYALELANVYRMMNNDEMMVEEYLNFASANPSNLNYVKNILQNLLKEDDDLQSLESILIEKVQKRPNETIFSELLIWVNLQRKNFYGAFLQARALEKRTKGNGGKLLDIGMIALENKAYEDAIEIFTYVTEEFPSSINYVISRRMTINAREELVKNSFPVDQNEIRNLVKDYELLVEEMGLNQNTLEALRNKALLHAFYLDERDVAINILEKIISTTRVDRELQAQCKIDLGDIYLLEGKPWESTLLYSQVEKSNKDTPIGYNAKLKNAKLNYYKGDFELAKSHLDILKLATSREIANDALSLSILIQDNTALDTSDFVMRKYASIDQLLFQKKYDSALTQLNKMLEEYPGHSLTDEIWWSMANVHMKLGSFEQAITYLQKIVDEYEYDILNDDAFFLMAQIYDQNLNNVEKAQELYQEFMKQHPGSKFVAEARNRYRTLRGDFIN